MSTTNNQQKHTNDKVQIDLTITTVEKMIKVFITKNKASDSTIKRAIYDLIKIMRLDTFDYEIGVRLVILAEILKVYYRNNIYDPSEIIAEISVNDEIKDILDQIVNSGQELSTNAIAKLNEFIATRLEYAFLFKNNKLMQDVVSKFSNRSYKSFGEITGEYAGIVKGFNNNFKAIEFKLRDQKTVMHLGMSDATDIAKDYLSSRKRSVRTGIKHLNKVLNGGWKQSRFYLTLAVPGGFKSGFLLNAALQAYLYNDDVQLKDPTKKPTVLFITLENTKQETLERMYSYETNKDLEQEEEVGVIAKFVEGYQSKDKHFLVKYMKAGATSVADIEAFIDDLEENGLEVFFVVVDYIMKLEPVSDVPIKDNHLRLGKIAADLKTLAIEKEIPVLSASQLNRDAEKKLEDAIEKNQNDRCKLLGRSDIGESKKLIDEADQAFVLNPEFYDGCSFLGVKDVKKRIRRGSGIYDTRYTYFAIPFRWEMRLETDINEENIDVCIPSIQEYLSEKTTAKIIDSKYNGVRDIDGLDDLDIFRPTMELTPLAFAKEEKKDVLAEASAAMDAFVEARKNGDVVDEPDEEDDRFKVATDDHFSDMPDEEYEDEEK